MARKLKELYLVDTYSDDSTESVCQEALESHLDGDDWEVIQSWGRSTGYCFRVRHADGTERSYELVIIASYGDSYTVALESDEE